MHEITVCNAIFHLMLHCSVQSYWQSSCEVAKVLMFLSTIFEGAQFLTEFNKAGSSLNVAKSEDVRTSCLGD